MSCLPPTADLNVRLGHGLLRSCMLLNALHKDACILLHKP
jgi:hypothetical protein